MHNYTKQYRMLKADDFSSVFVLRKLVRTEFFSLHYKVNNLGYSRLGLIVSKKVEKTAVGRNYMKRFAREYFRTHEIRDLSVDVVFRVSKSFGPEVFSQQTAQIEWAVSKIKKYMHN